MIAKGMRLSLGPVRQGRNLITPATRYFSHHTRYDHRYVKVSEEVQQAIAEHRAVVALESTIYTHGFPYPENVALASGLEAIVRAFGATPATVGILDGVARIGLQQGELLRLAASSQQPQDLLKVSRRDLAYALAARSPNGKPYCGGTTVSGTMLLANLAGIRVFATGGLGGVHRGASDTFDISADLTELGRTPVAVVAAGCKAFLDIPKTLEYLETQGVGVLTFADGRSGEVDFPGFWSRDSGCKSPMTVRNASEAAEIIHAQHIMGMQCGLLFGNPVPKEHEIPLANIKNAIDGALNQAKTSGMTGNRATPFILAKIKELTGSDSVRANTALVENNVKVGTRIAVELARLEQTKAQSLPSGAFQPAPNRVASTTEPDVKSTIPAFPTLHNPAQVHTPTEEHSSPNVFVAGMLAVDLACDYASREGSSSRFLELNTSNPAKITQSLGGVGNNVARAAQLSGVAVRLCSAVGDDMNGRAALEALAKDGADTSGIMVLPSSSGRRTAQYVAVNDETKELVVAMADMKILDDTTDSLIADTLDSFWLDQLRSCQPSHIVIDANWPSVHLQTWLHAAKDIDSYVIFEPVSNAKSIGLFQLPPHGQQPFDTLGIYPNSSVQLITPNQTELTSMYETAQERGFFESRAWWDVIDAFGIPSSGVRPQLVLATSSELVDQGIPQKSLQLLPYIPCITTKLGAQGVLVTQILSTGDARLTSSEYAPYILSRCNNGSEEAVGVGGVYMRLFPAAEIVDAADVVSVNGVGDTFAGVLVAGLVKAAQQHKALRVEDHIDIAQRASVLTLKSAEAVSPGLGVLSMLI